MNAHARSLATYAEATDDSAAAIARWREGGGYEGAVARHAARGASSTTKAATGHMPYPGHRHMGEM